MMGTTSFNLFGKPNPYKKVDATPATGEEDQKEITSRYRNSIDIFKKMLEPTESVQIEANLTSPSPPEPDLPASQIKMRYLQRR